MGDSITSIEPDELVARLGTAAAPLVFDVRRRAAYDEAADVIPTAVWRDHRTADAWGREIPPGTDVVVYCVHGEQVGQSARSLLASVGVSARFLTGGIEGYRSAGGPTVLKLAKLSDTTRWVTRERPKIDRIACPWFIRRFVDPKAAIHYVAADWVLATAKELDAVPFDVSDVELSHRGDRCSFDALLEMFAFRDRAMDRLATIVRGADTGRLDLAPQSAGLLAMSLGLSALQKDDAAMLAQGMTLYDALYAWCRHASGESHNWTPAPALEQAR